MTNKEEKPLQSLIAGTIAGGTEAFVTYPTEFVKTRSQFGGQGIAGLYTGASVTVIGHAVKAGVRFVSYEHFKAMLADSEGRVSTPRSLIAGLGAGMMEAIVAVTPSETIKTKLIDDAKRPTPQYRGLVHGTMTIVREEGIAGIYQGLFPLMMRQGVISAIRFSTYTTLKQYIQSSARSDKQLPSGITFGIGSIAGFVTVYVTQPLDVVKTRMQTLDAAREYKHTFHCGYRILREEGFTRLWAGATPRLVGLVAGGGIFFTVYENIMSIIA